MFFPQYFFRLAYYSSDFADELCDALGRIGFDLLPSIFKTGEDPSSVRCHGLSWMLRASTRRPALGSRLAGQCLTTEVVDAILKDEVCFLPAEGVMCLPHKKYTKTQNILRYIAWHFYVFYFFWGGACVGNMWGKFIIFELFYALFL